MFSKVMVHATAILRSRGPSGAHVSGPGKVFAANISLQHRTSHNLVPRSAAPAVDTSSSIQIYTDPHIYDLAFGFRDFDAEVDYMLATYRQRSSATLQRFLELAAGPARHAILVSQRTGAESVAVDISPEMVAYAKAQAAAADLGSGSISILQADMCQPLPTHLHSSVDLAAILLGSLAHCTDNAAALECFHHASTCLRSGGLLLVELPHVDELFAGTYQGLETYADGWESPSPDGSKYVVVEWGREGDEFDSGTQVLQRTVGMTLFEGEQILSTVEVVPQRQFTLQEIDLLGRAAGLKIVGVHGDHNASITLDNDEACRMLVWLQKTDQQ